MTALNVAVQGMLLRLIFDFKGRLTYSFEILNISCFFKHSYL